MSIRPWVGGPHTSSIVGFLAVDGQMQGGGPVLPIGQDGMVPDAQFQGPGQEGVRGVSGREIRYPAGQQALPVGDEKPGEAHADDEAVGMGIGRAPGVQIGIAHGAVRGRSGPRAAFLSVFSGHVLRVLREILVPRGPG
jgi:hypothetical protein